MDPCTVTRLCTNSQRGVRIPKISNHHQNCVSNHIQSLNAPKCGAEGKRISQIAQTARAPHKRGWQGVKISRANTCAKNGPRGQRDQGAHTRTCTMEQHSDKSTSPRQVSRQHEQFKHIWKKMRSHSHICPVSLPLPSWSFTLLACHSQGIGHFHLSRRKKLGEPRFDKPLISPTN